jgi:hypothetical protein
MRCQLLVILGAVNPVKVAKVLLTTRHGTSALRSSIENAGLCGATAYLAAKVVLMATGGVTLVKML